MRTILIGAILGASLGISQHSLLDRQTLNNEGIVDLARAGFSEAFILDLVQYKRTKFDTSVDGLTFLAKKGLSERVIRAIVANSDKPEGGSVATPIVPEGMRIMPYYAYDSGYLPTLATQRSERWYMTSGMAKDPKAAEPVNGKKKK